MSPETLDPVLIAVAELVPTGSIGLDRVDRPWMWLQAVAAVSQWRQRLVDNPESLEELERDVHESFAGGADLVTAGLVSMTMQRKEFARDTDDTRRNFEFGLHTGREREIRLKLP